MRPLPWLIAAALVHLLIVLLIYLRVTPKPHRPVASTPEPAETPTEITITFPSAPDDGKLTVEGSAPLRPASVAAAARAGRSRPIEGPPPLPEEGTPAEPAAPSTSSTTSPSLSLAQLGIGAAGPNPFLLPDALPERPPDPKDNTAGRALKSGLVERDLALGLGPEGPVLEALREATSMSASPERGYAIFGVSIDENGFVKDIRLGDRAGGPGWDEAMTGALKALKGKKLALRGGARGAELKIEIKSDVVLPSGNRPDQRIQTPMTRSQISRSESVPGGTPGVVESRTIATFDVTDIGAKPRRVVHAHLVSATML